MAGEGGSGGWRAVFKYALTGLVISHIQWFGISALYLLN